MRNVARTLKLASSLIVVGLCAPSAAYAATRTFVSGKGNDANACTRAAPCRTFAVAITKTDLAGEIDVIDAGDYGPVTITRAVSIVQDGAGTAGVFSLAGGNAITINAGANDAVHLRGLTLEGLGTGVSGILLNSGGSLTVENCIARNFTFMGIYMAPTAATTFLISNTSLYKNSNSGISINPQGPGSAIGVIDHVRATNNSTGIAAGGGGSTGTLHVTVTDSVSSNNITNGVYSNTHVGTAATTITIRNTVISNNSNGVYNTEASILQIAHSTVTGNLVGVSINGSNVYSYGDNNINKNGTDISGGTLILQATQ